MVSFAAAAQGSSVDKRLGGVEESVKNHDRYVRQLLNAVTDLNRKLVTGKPHDPTVGVLDTMDIQSQKSARPAAEAHPSEPSVKKSAKGCLRFYNGMLGV